MFIIEDVVCSGVEPECIILSGRILETYFYEHACCAVNYDLIE